MRPIGTFTVTPTLPPELARLRELALNLRWAWNHEAIELFRSLDDDLWESTNHNPIRMLGEIDQSKLEQAAADPGFQTRLERVAEDFDAYMAGGGSWYAQHHRPESGPLVAYFSAEFGITDCLSIFAGGLGLLAGDHLKSASDLGLPLVGVGLLYQQGYFRQYLNEAGWQQEAYEDNDFSTLPLSLVRLPDGAPLVVEIRLPGRPVRAQVWRAQVGRVSLYMMDTNIPANRLSEDRDITDQLYGGDNEMRLKQEILLGVGGCRVLAALGLEPKVYHMNEGHSAFLALERICQLMDLCGLTFAEARELASASLVFTTHTPVPAGHDRFPANLMEMYFGDYYQHRLGLTRAEFLALGRERPGDEGELFSMSTLALRLSAYSNGVSALHGKVARQMACGLWPNVPVDEVPIGHVTNGVHFQSWISRETEQLYDRYLGARWRQDPSDDKLWELVERVPAEELWRTHERRRERLLVFVRRRLREQLARRGALRAELEGADDVLDLGALTIGFARRFATYKRATLLLRDPDRLARLLNNPDRPVQIIFAGKAHPHDNGGKELIQQVVTLARQAPLRRRIVFLENYGMAAARYLVQGCDLWLNNPLRPLEASGTSGMKALANGVVNMSTLDGWWDEAWISADPHGPPVGWAIGRGESYDNPEYQNQVEAEALYNLLERDVVPAFYERGADDLPRRWIALMKSSIGQLCSFYNTHRMVREYAEHFYLPAIQRYDRLSAGETDGARAVAAWRCRVEQAWPGISVESVKAERPEKPEVGSGLTVSATVNLNGLKPDDVVVQLYLGRIDGKGEIVDAQAFPLDVAGPDGDRRYVFHASGVSTTRSGLHGYTVRILPNHSDLATRFLPGLIRGLPHKLRSETPGLLIESTNARPGHVTARSLLARGEVVAQTLMTNPLREGLRLRRTPEPCAVVIFGATGDLTRRKLVPALYDLARDQLLPGGFSVVGFARSDLGEDGLEGRLHDGVSKYARTGPVDGPLWSSFAEGISYFRGDYDDVEAYRRLDERLGEIDRDRGTSGNRLFYLATPPSSYEPIIRNLGRSGLAHETPSTGWRRIVVEKPFGHDLRSAQELNSQLARVFEERQVYRIDHYLGKETVQNILVFRFSNGIFEPIWNRRYVDNVQITVAESIGVEGRGGYYEEAGALRDMVQNHVLQLVSLVAMEPPVAFEADTVRDEKVKVLRAVRPLEAAEIAEATVRGQYGRGWIDGQAVPGYREEQGVSPDSRTETFVGIRLFIDNWRWADVPFYLRVGKRLPKRTTEVAIQFRRAPLLLFGRTSAERPEPSVLVLRIQPDEGISLQFGAKLPGPTIRVRSVAMDFRYGSSFGTTPPDAYERLLLDCMLGDSTLFTRRDEVEAAWLFVTRILDGWSALNEPLPEYEAGTWGPAEADRLVQREGRSWRRP